MKIPTKNFIGGFKLPVYGLGTWQMGGRWESDSTRDDKEIEAIQGAIDRGITHIDTAESYGNGHAEEIIGKVLKNNDRSKLFIASKVSATNQCYDDLLNSFNSTLSRLRTDYLDLYLLHRYPEPGMPIAKTMKAMNLLVDTGRVKQIGVCNMSVNRLKEVQKYSKYPIVCNQLHYSLACREIVKRGVLEYCQKNNIAIVAWGPLQKGQLEQTDLLNNLAKKYQKTPYQVALNWLISQEGVVTIPKTSNMKHLDENLGSLGWGLNDKDMESLTRDFPGQYYKSDRVPLNYEADVKV
jgi:diketogulonate reductase-like aldo/keto reductase